MDEVVKMLPRYRTSVINKKRTNKRKTHEEYVEELKVKNPTVEVIDKYINSNTKITHHCLIHDIYWKTIPATVLVGKGCALCKSSKIQSSLGMTHEDFLKKLYNINQNIEINSTYISSSKNIKCKCKICNHLWETRAGRLLQGHGCPNCAHQNLANKSRKTHEQFIKELKTINPYVSVIDKYVTTHQKVTCKCKICNYQWMVTPSHLLRGKGCPSCSESIGERNVGIFLSSNGLSYTKNYTYNDLIGIGGGLLSYDFYLQKYNLLIEFQGEQHERPIEFFGGEEQFKIQQEHDKRKRNYAKEHNINLLEIWYYDIDNIEEIITKYINNLKLESVTTTGVA